MNDTAPTASAYAFGGYMGAHTDTGDGAGETQDKMLWSFKSVPSFSKYGLAYGNGDSNGTYVYLGFAPAFVMTKQLSGSGSWNIVDNRRQTFNESVGRPVIYADATAAEDAGTDTMQGQMDLLSNGFKFRSNNSSGNGSNARIVYWAMAEIPFKYSNAI